MVSFRLEQERHPSKADMDVRLAKKQKRARTENLVQGIGKPAEDMRMVTMENYQRRKVGD